MSSEHSASIRLAVRLLSSAVPKVQNDLKDAKPFSEMPGPKGLPFVGNILTLPLYLMNSEEQHVQLKKAFDKYGPIFKEKIGHFELVNLCEINAVEKVHRREGKFPRRLIVNAWSRWREDQNHAKGVLIR